MIRSRVPDWTILIVPGDKLGQIFSHFWGDLKNHNFLSENRCA